MSAYLSSKYKMLTEPGGAGSNPMSESFPESSSQLGPILDPIKPGGCARTGTADSTTAAAGKSASSFPNRKSFRAEPFLKSKELAA